MSDKGGEIIPPLPAREMRGKNFDLASNPSMNKNPPVKSDTNTGYKSPAVMMAELGFDPTKYMTPLQFLVALMNDDLALLFRNPKRLKNIENKGGIGLNHRIEAAKAAAKYMHMAMPTINIQQGDAAGFGGKLAEAVASGNERVRTKRIILETVERISPDIPLTPANYPEAFTNQIEGRIIEGNPEGDTDYDPDRDD